MSRSPSLLALRAPRARSALASALLPCAIALALTACGGGGSAVRSTPPPPTTPGGLGFTPTVANDASLTQSNPPAIPAQGAPVSFASPSLAQHLILTNAAGALGAGLKGQGVTIGFVDSGVNRNNPTLAGRVVRNFVHVSSPPNDLSVDDKVGHGTVVAELAAGRPATGLYYNQDGTYSNQTGTWPGGVAQDALIVSSRIISDAPPSDDGSGAGNEIHAGEGYGDFFAAINAELANAGAKIINNSWGGLYWNDPALSTELANAWKQFVVGRGGIIVFANGNSGRDPRYVGNPSDNAMLPTKANDPALEKGWLTVGALDPANPTQLTDYSQQCGQAMNYCLVAPGNVTYIDPAATSAANSGLLRGGGTSYAAPLVSGAAAVVWSAFPYLSNDQVRQLILGGAKDLGAPGVDPVFGWGLLDVTRAANGPSNFAWGDFAVSFSGTSVWRNEIVGSGGLVKDGSGTLTLAEAGRFSGDTRVNGGGLDIRKGLASNLAIASGATVWASGALGGNVDNRGLFLNGASAPATIAGNFTQASSGNLGVWLGSPLKITGSASLAGQMSILGVKSGYTTSAKETLLTANGGVSGTFASLKAAPNVFLDASLGYDPNNVFLNITRIDVSKAVAGMGLSLATQLAAQRVEGAMQGLDAQLAGQLPVTASAAFIAAAGALQQAPSIASADLSLRSLGGQLYAADAALTLDGLEAGRRALEGRLDALARDPWRAGGWYRDLASGGQLAQSGFDAIALDSRGELVGNDWRLGPGLVAGVALQRQWQRSWLSALGDRSQGVQRQAQAYLLARQGAWYGQMQLASGSFDRQIERHLVLGTQQEQVAARLGGRYASAYAEAGHRFDLGGLALVPYAGAQYVRIWNDGFAEQGLTGFGLQAQAWDSQRWQGLAGVRASHAWQWGGLALRADARAEWQRTLAASGLVFAASYTGLEQWAPLQGIGLGRQARWLGLGLDAAFSPRAGLRFDLGQRRGVAGSERLASVQAQYRF